MNPQRLSPGAWLSIAVLSGVVLSIGMVLLALARPWLGLELRWDEAAGGARVVHASGPAAAIAPGTVLRTATDGELRMRLAAIDFTIEPDGNLQSYADYDEFLARQDRLAAIQSAATVQFIDAADRVHAVQPRAYRPIDTLPAAFWIQIFVGLFAWLIVAAVWVFRPRDAAARYLLLNGLCIWASASGAAVYTTREFAVPLDTLLLLKTLNFGGGLMFFGTLLALLWHYPRRLGSHWVGVGFVLAYLAWYVAQALDAVDSMMVGRRWPVFAAMVGILALALVQWLNTRRDPVGRAALQWFLLSWMVGTSLFVVVVFVPQVYGVDTAHVQGYSFLLILLIYAGLGFGVARFRLFELGEWWFRTVTWVLGALMLVALDLLLLLGMHLSFTLSLTLSLVICGFLWLPLRGWLWLRLMNRNRVPEVDLFKRALHVALAPNAEQREQRWRGLLQGLFTPLRVDAVEAPTQLAVAADGLALTVPTAGRLPSLRLEYPDEGRRLFTPRDVMLVRQLIDMVDHASTSRDAYNQGVRDERERIARDLHDDLGSQLLTALHQQHLEPARASIGKAIATMRGILDQLTGKEVSLQLAIAELRHETRQRLDGSGITLAWPVNEDPQQDPSLEYGVYRHYLSMVRELLANIIRHAAAQRIAVRVRLEAGQLVTEIEDDGCGFDGAGRGGYGLDNLDLRLTALRGSLEYQPCEPGTRTRLAFPLPLAADDAGLRASGHIG